MPFTRGRRAHRGLRPLAWTVAVLVAVPALVYLLWPWLVGRLGHVLAAPLGLDALELQVGRPGWAGISVPHVRLQRGGVTLRASDGQVGYRLGGLLAGEVDSIRLRQATVRLTAEPGAGGARGPDPAGWPDPALLAALPADRLRVDELVVEVPELSFTARGGLELAAGVLEARLAGVAPEAASPFELHARLTADGGLSLRVASADDTEAPVLVVEAKPAGDALMVAGAMNLPAHVLALVGRLADLPAGEGQVAGPFSAVLPWPFSANRDWPEVSARGGLRMDWRAEAVPLAAQEVQVTWQLSGGAVAADVSGRLAHGDDVLALRGRVDELFLQPLRGRGALALGPPDESAGRPQARLEWTLQPAGVELDGGFDLRGGLMERLAAEAGMPPGRAELTGEVQAQLPWPVPSDFDPWMVPARGSLSGRWRPEAGDVAVELRRGRWALEAGELAGRVEAALRRGDGALTAVVAVDSLVLTEDPLRVNGTLELQGGHRLPFAGRYQRASGAAALRAEGRIEVEDPLLAELVADWQAPVDVTAGVLELQAALEWPPSEGMSGSVQVGLEDLEAHWRDYVVAGLSSRLRLAVRAGVWSLPPAPLVAARVDAGVVIHDVESTVGWTGDVVSVQETRARLLGGRVRAAPFAYRVPAGEARFVLELEDLELGRVLALEGEHVSGTGTLDGTLPVHLVGNVPRIEGGRLRADDPGGVIRVSSALAGGTGQPGLDFALRALQNFHYSALEAGVDYGEDGELALAVRLEGRNPTVESGRPIHYNLNVTENVPALLESLRLQQDITRGIESRVTN